MAKLELVFTGKDGKVLKSLIRQSDREVLLDVVDNAQERLDDYAAIVAKHDMRDYGTESLFIPAVHGDEGTYKLLDEIDETLNKLS